MELDFYHRDTLTLIRTSQKLEGLDSTLKLDFNWMLLLVAFEMQLVEIDESIARLNILVDVF